MTKVYIKEKRFLKNFIIILLILLVIAAAVVSVVYRMSINALENEIHNMYQSTTDELLDKMEDAIAQTNYTGSRLILDSRVQLYYTHYAPDYLLDGYYGLVDEKLRGHAISYIDTIILYAPKYDRMMTSQRPEKTYSMEEVKKQASMVDITWLEDVLKLEGRGTSIVVRARNDRWPYYLSVMKNWRTTSLDGYVVLNINLVKLHDHLIAGRSDTMKIFLVDEDEQVILEEDKESLFKPVSQVEFLTPYRPGESFTQLRSENGHNYMYAQAYSEKYGLTFVTYTLVDDYYSQISTTQRNLILALCVSVLVAVSLAGIYSIKLVKPLQDIQRLLSSPAVVEENKGQYDENIRDIADQIISHLQTNSTLRRELDSRLDLLKDTQMLALQAQINPHFLFNTLNAISLTVESDCGNAHPGVLMLNELSYVLRYSLSDSGNVSIWEELEFVKKYLTIMEYRHGDLNITIDVDESLYNCAIPKLVLQPMVENSIQHGLAKLTDGRKGALTLSITKRLHKYPDGVECPSVWLEIKDNGVGIGQEQLEKLRKRIGGYSGISREHIGLSNVSHRFYLMFHNEQQVQVDSVEGEGTCIRVIFPMKNLEDT